MDARARLLDRVPPDLRLGAEVRYAAARAEFDAFAATRPSDPDAPKHGPINLTQIHLSAWQARNFGPARATEIACGLAEELGELAAAESEGDPDAIADAHGDLLVYAAQFATAHRLAMGACMPAMRLPLAEAHVALARGVGLAAHVALKSAQKIRGFHDRDLAWLGAFLAIELIVVGVRSSLADPRRALIVVASKVLARDWIANPDTGGT